MKPQQLLLLPLLVSACRSDVLPPEPPEPPVTVDCNAVGHVNDTEAELVACITAENTFDHLLALENIADQNGGNRAAGEPGYTASVDYVLETLAESGWLLSREPFSFFDFNILANPVFSRQDTTPQDFAFNTEFRLASFSGNGDVTAQVQPIDVALGPNNTTTSGCEADDFLSFEAGKIALIQRGTCTFLTKVLNAQQAGASGVIIFNQGNNPNREGIFFASLEGGQGITVPVFTIPYALGETFVNELPTLRMQSFTEEVEVLSENVIAETPTGDANNIVMLGAHLDSVLAGPGINDNGSGSAALLELALQLKGYAPNNKIRLAWWGAEELGLIGSISYVDSHALSDLASVAVYLNFDMIASPNFIRAIYDGDGSDFGLEGPSGSDKLEQLFEDFFATRSLSTISTAFDGRSDYFGFIQNGVASGGLFTGAEDIKTSSEADLFGGSAGSAHDSCYHQGCDGSDNIDLGVLEEMTDAIASVTMLLSKDLSFVQQRSARSTKIPTKLRVGGCHNSVPAETE